MTLTVEDKLGGAQHGRVANDYLSFERAQGSIDALDGLRTLAIVLVLFRHAMKAMEPQLGSAFELNVPFGTWSLATPMMNGWMGVDLFFVLSGFLIGSHLIRRRQTFTWSSLGRYFGARAMRIVPTYYCVLFLVAAGFFPLFKPLAEHTMPSLAWHMLFLQDYLPSDFIVAFWSLGVEEKFYILAPVLIIGTSRLGAVSHRLALFALLAATPMVLRLLTLESIQFDFDSYRAYFETFRSPFHLTFDGLLIGVVCAEIYASTSLKAKLGSFAPKLVKLGTAIILLHLIPINLMDQIGFYDVVLQPLILSMGFGLLLLGTALINPTKGWAASRFSLIGARLSYSLYLVHMALIPAAMVPALLSGTQGLALFGVFFIAFIILSVIASLALHFAVEKPFLMLKSRWF